MWGITQRSSAWLKCCVRLWDQASTLGVWENSFKREKRKEKKHRLDPSHAHILSSNVNHPSYRANSSLWEVSDSIRKLVTGWIVIWIFESLVTGSSLLCLWEGLATLLRLALKYCLHRFKALGLQVHITHARVLTYAALSTFLSAM